MRSRRNDTICSSLNYGGCWLDFRSSDDRHLFDITLYDLASGSMSGINCFTITVKMGCL